MVLRIFSKNLKQKFAKLIVKGRCLWSLKKITKKKPIWVNQKKKIKKNGVKIIGNKKPIKKFLENLNRKW